MYFLPLDPSWPQSRLRRVLQDIGPAIVLWAERSAGGMRSLVLLHTRRCLVANFHHSSVAMHTVRVLVPCAGSGQAPGAGHGSAHCGVQIRDELVEALSMLPVCSIAARKDPAQAVSMREDMAQQRPQQRGAYVMPTSGSTGAPLTVRGTLEGPASLQALTVMQWASPCPLPSV